MKNRCLFFSSLTTILLFFTTVVLATPVPPGPPIVNIVSATGSNQVCRGSVTEIQAVIDSSSIVFQPGNVAPNGGLITFDKGNNSNGWRYLQLAPYDILLPDSLIAGIGCACQNVSAFNEGPGGGYENFQAWLASPCASEWLHYLDTLQLLGFDDWYIPSLNELNSVYNLLSVNSTSYIGTFQDDFYWTSSAASFGTCNNSGGIYQKSMQTGLVTSVDRNFSQGRIRLMRRFSNLPTYLWSNGSSSPFINIANNQEGYYEYSVQVSAYFVNYSYPLYSYVVTIPSDFSTVSAGIGISVVPIVQTLNETIVAGDSILFNGSYRKEAGSYSQVFTNNQGCDSTVVLNLSLVQPEIDCSIGLRRENNQWRLSLPFFDPEGPGFSGNTTIYNWSNGANTASILVGQNGSGVYSVSVSNGQRSCESSIGLNLNVPSSTNIDTTLSAGQSIVFNGQSITTAGTYTATLQNAAGCDSVVTLELSVQQPLICAIESSIQSICEGDFAFLEIQSPSNQSDISNALFNPGDPNPWNSPSPENGGYIPLGSFGTPSTFSISCFINPSDIQAGISIILDCSHGGNSNWVIQNYPNISSGSNWSFGNLPIVLNPNTWQHLLITYENGVRKCFVNGILQSTSYQLINWAGAPSLFLGNWPEGARRFHGGIDELYITYDIQHSDNFAPLDYISNPTPTALGLWHFDEGLGFTTQSSTGQPFNINNWLWASRNIDGTNILWSTGETTPSISVSPSETTIYSVTVTQGNQTCTSEVTINVNQPSAETINASITQGETYNFNGQSLTAAGTYTDTLQNEAGCDSVVTLNLEVNPILVNCQASSNNNLICQGESTALIIETNANPAGTNNQQGFFEDFNDCNLDNFTFSGGTISITQNAFEGSCAVGMTHYAGEAPNNFYPSGLNFHYGTYSVIANATAFISDNYMYLFQGDNLEGGLRVFSLPNNTDNPGFYVQGLGIDYYSSQVNVSSGQWYEMKVEVFPSIINVYINSELKFSTTQFVAPSPGRFKLGVAFSGNYDNMRFIPYGNPSNILWSTGETTQSITVSPSETTTYSVTVTQGNQTCTSEVTINVNQPSAVSETVSACNSYTWNGNTYTQSGTYTWTGNNASGCDSVVTLNLTITPQPEQPQLACWQSANFNATTCSWDVTGTQPQQPTNLACWQSANFNTTTCSWDVIGTPAPAIVTNASACVGYTWEANGETYSASGQYSFNSNCQDYTLNLTINQPSSETINANITEGESYSFNGQSLTTAGTYTAAFQNAAGCDSTVTLNLSVVPAPPAGCYAATVVDFSQGLNSVGLPVEPARSHAIFALGAPEAVLDGIVNFVSLGFGGSITLAFEAPVANGAGADIRIDEATWGINPCNRYPETADVFASQDGINFVYLGRGCQDMSLDLGPLSWAQYIRITDVSDILSFRAGSDGYDVNGIECLNGTASITGDDGLVACSLQEVVSYTPGNRKNGTPVITSRRNPTNALGTPQNNNTINFVSLGFGGTLVAKFDYVVFNQPGNDLRITETSFGNPNCTNYPEKARISMSLDNLNWVELGEICLDGEVDLGTLPYAQYIKIQDASPLSSTRFSGTADGFDIDAVVVLNNGCVNTASRSAEFDNISTADETPVMEAYPNPMAEETSIRFGNVQAETDIRIELFDASGRLVLSQNARIDAEQNVVIIPTSNIAKGMYHLVVNTGDESFRERLVK